MVLLLLDWENIVYSLLGLGPSKMNLLKRIERLIEWVTENIGDIFSGYGFVFVPSHITSYHRDICDRNRLKIMICPKRKVKKYKEEDTVDETLIWFGRMMMNLPGIKFICLVSGDEDFVPLLQEAKNRGIKVALVVPALSCLSDDKVIVQLIDCHPQTGKKMVVRLDKILDKPDKSKG